MGHFMKLGWHMLLFWGSKIELRAPKTNATNTNTCNIKEE